MTQLPRNIDDITPATLNSILIDNNARIGSITIKDIKRFGDGNVSTSERAHIAVEYAANPSGLPEHLVVKMTADSSAYCTQLHAIYVNEVDFYTRLRPQIDIETPKTAGGFFDPASNRYALLLEDIAVRGARFTSIKDDYNVENAKSILDTLAKLHSGFWNSPRFATDLKWVQSHTQGNVHDLMHGLIRQGIRAEIEKEKFKREFLGRMRVTEEELHRGFTALQRHQSTLPQTLLHGDPHIGNVYLLPDGTGGLYDWQISVRGCAIHDITYHIVTSLPIEIRRAQEKALIAYYLDRLGTYSDADVPTLDEFWLEYRRACLWGVYIGWLTCPITNYGWEVNILAHLRVTTAFEDHDTKRLVAELA